MKSSKVARISAHDPTRFTIEYGAPRWILLMGLLFFLVGAGSFFILGQTRELACTRLEPSLVRCELASNWFGIPVSSRTLDGLTDAFVDVSSDSDGDTYRVVFVTSEGSVPLTGYYSSGRAGKEQIAFNVRSFLSAREVESAMVVDTPDIWAFLFSFIFMTVGLGMTFPGMGKRELRMDRARNEFVYRHRGPLTRGDKRYALAEVQEIYFQRNDNTVRPAVRLRSGESIPLRSAYITPDGAETQAVNAANDFLRGDMPS